MNEEENKVEEQVVETTEETPVEEPVTESTEAVKKQKVEEPVVQEEQKNEEVPQESNGNNKKSNNLFIIALLVIIVLLLVIIVILLPGGKDKSNNENEDNKVQLNIENKNNEIEPEPTPEHTPVVEEMDINSDQVKNIMNRFYRISISENELYKNDEYNIYNISIDDLIMTALKSLSGSEYEPSPCSNDSKIVSISYLNDSLSKIVKNKTIDYSTLNNEIKNVIPNDGIYGPDKYEIIDNDNIKVYFTMCDNLPYGDYVSSKIIKAEKVSNNVYIYEKKAFAKYDEFNIPYSIVSYYLDYSKSGDKIETIDQSTHKEISWDLYNTYKYTFKLIDGEYYFQSLELVK